MQTRTDKLVVCFCLVWSALQFGHVRANVEREHSYFVHVAKARAWRQREDMIDDVRKMKKHNVQTPGRVHTNFANTVIDV